MIRWGGGLSIFLQIRDVYSMFVCVSALVNKYYVTLVIKTDVAEVERLTGCRLVYWRNDGGTSF